jgi:hypothetical protein
MKHIKRVAFLRNSTEITPSSDELIKTEEKALMLFEMYAKQAIYHSAKFPKEKGLEKLRENFNLSSRDLEKIKPDFEALQESLKQNTIKSKLSRMISQISKNIFNSKKKAHKISPNVLEDEKQAEPEETRKQQAASIRTCLSNKIFSDPNHYVSNIFNKITEKSKNQAR